MKNAEDYILTWCDNQYGNGKELEDWCTSEVMEFANDFSVLNALMFAEFINTNGYVFHNTVGWFNSELVPMTTMELYEQFKSKQK